ncbi:MAG TPA: ribose 5-phosphate isomerase B [Bacteroidales bacterium]|jgi:ribose 5-phosphate isomerase B|nr:ribose 5-phosphate isomerase B [Bacteroidales bacterium]
MKIAFACDHAGFSRKAGLMEYLRNKGHEITDLGCYSSEASDYPDYGHLLAEHVASGKSDLGISLCGSGNGINMTANKHQEIRSAICWNPEIARLAKSHNNANVIAIPARFVSANEAELIADSFLNASFEGGRHQRRIDKIPIKK